ncbi:MAG: type II toxin-antitoxin system Phd/YefM family antitoxin [Acidobacteria bacterium]|nr:type II toxin-antitoxin system Phd/YefM family antitoxin [Acidobacteriota bacterium]
MKVELVTTLKREAAKILAELRESKEPVLITEHGLPTAYLVSVEDYELTERRLEILAGLSRGEKAILDRKTVTHSHAKSKMKKWLE